MSVPDGGKAGAYCVYVSEPQPLTFAYIHDIGWKRLVKRPSSSEDVPYPIGVPGPDFRFAIQSLGDRHPSAVPRRPHRLPTIQSLNSAGSAIPAVFCDTSSIER